MTRRIRWLAALATLTVLGSYAYWYMMRCEGAWDGEPLEVTRAAELPALEESLRAEVSYLADTIGPRNPSHSAALAKAADWVRSGWESQGYAVKSQTFLVNGVECANLEIEIPGRTRPSEIVLLSAQYDTWPDSPGANNNGSGMAVLLELSRMLRNHQPDRTVRLVAFTTQEPPFDNTDSMGSLIYARRSRALGENIRVMMSMDAIGIYRHEPGSQNLPFPFSLFYPDKADFLGFIADLGSRARLVEATRGFHRGSAFPIEAGSVPRWVRGARWSDHNSFWNNGYHGIQITDTGAFRSPSHTRPDDTIEKIDFVALARITFGMYGAVIELSTVVGSST